MTHAQRHAAAFDRVISRLVRSSARDTLAPVFILLSIVYLVLVLTPHVLVSEALERRRRRKLARMIVLRIEDRELLERIKRGEVKHLSIGREVKR